MNFIEKARLYLKWDRLIPLQVAITELANRNYFSNIYTVCYHVFIEKNPPSTQDLPTKYQAVFESGRNLL